MSYDVNRYWFYKIKGRKLRLYKYAESSGIIDNQGRITGNNSGELSYPNETITNGLRIEYRRLHEPFVTADPVTTNTLTEDASPSESSHVNLNKMLSLAVVEFVKAKVAERRGDLKEKEYYMREYYKKLSDNESNLKKVFITGTQSVYALR